MPSFSRRSRSLSAASLGALPCTSSIFLSLSRAATSEPASAPIAAASLMQSASIIASIPLAARCMRRTAAGRIVAARYGNGSRLGSRAASTAPRIALSVAGLCEAILVSAADAASAAFELLPLPCSSETSGGMPPASRMAPLLLGPSRGQRLPLVSCASAHAASAAAGPPGRSSATSAGMPAVKSASSPVAPRLLGDFGSSSCANSRSALALRSSSASKRARRDGGGGGGGVGAMCWYPVAGLGNHRQGTTYRIMIAHSIKLLYTFIIRSMRPIQVTVYTIDLNTVPVPVYGIPVRTVYRYIRYRYR